MSLRPTAEAAEATTREVTAAIGALCLAMLFFSFNDVFTKFARAYWPTGQVLSLRGAMALALMLIWLRLAGLHGRIGAIGERPVMLRAALEGLVAILFIAAIGLLPLANLVAIVMASTLIGTALSVPILRESVGWRRWSAIGVGFVGMLFVVQPTGEASALGVVLAVASAFGIACRDLSTRFVPSAIPSLVVTLGTVLGSCLAGVALLPFEEAAPVEPIVIAYLAGSAVCIIAGNYCSILAFRKVAIGIVSPYRYTSVIWATLASGLIFGEWPGALVGVGMALIVASGLYTLHRERVRRRESRQPGTLAGPASG
jgi:drug/metabolite transporter (DMT)-like permease